MTDSLNIEKETCGHCGLIATGVAYIGEVRYCHSDVYAGLNTCYEIASQKFGEPLEPIFRLGD